MPFLLLVVVIGIIVATTRSARRTTGSGQNNAPRNYKDSPNPWQNVSAAQRQAELKKKLEENARRRAAEAQAAASRAASSASQAKPAVVKPTADRRPLEKRSMQNELRREKPIAVHTDADCGGGSIHDGYHEGVTQFPNGRPAAVAGKLGYTLAQEDDAQVKAAAAAENARRAMARISKLPPLAQGMIYSEILGKPKSETA